MYLHLDHNQLSGSISSQLGNITNLTCLELQNNQLTGVIPTSLTNLSQLRGLFYWNAATTAWEDASGTCPGGVVTRNTEENWISLPLCHLSEFALLTSGVQKLYLPMLMR